jgi:RHS repeat-associated protein
VTGPSGSTDFVYDAEGDRLIKHDPTGASLYLGDTEVRWDNVGADSVTSTRYYQFNGATVAMRTSSTAVENLMADHHGTATVSIDRTSGELSRRWMDPFGAPRGQTPTWDPKSRGFVDGKVDPSTRLTHLGAREYDPSLGRFISVDPLVDSTDPQSMNAYAYSNNSPVTFSDPAGTMYAGVKGARDGSDGNPDHSTMVNEGTLAGTPKWHAKHDNDRTASNDAEEAVSQHARVQHEAKERIKRVIKDLVKIVADELGITDALNCFTEGDLSSCVATGITVIGSFVGGMAGKILAKYGAPWKWKKAAALVGKLKDLASEALDGIKDWRAATKALETCAPNSFLPGSLVLLADGSTKDIAKVKPGDRVLAADPTSGKIASEPVVATIIGRGQKQLVDLTITATDSDGRSAVARITATSGHPFYSPSNGMWLTAGQLAVGADLSSVLAGRRAVVSAVRTYGRSAVVHNLTIGTLHTYYVMAGNTPVLVHNCDPAAIAARNGGEAVDAGFQFGNRRGPGRQLLKWPVTWALILVQYVLPSSEVVHSGCETPIVSLGARAPMEL